MFVSPPSHCLAQDPPARVLIYSATQGFRHDSIPTAIQALKEKGPTVQIEFDNTEDENQFTDNNLARYDAIVFLSTTGEVLQAPGKTAFQNYLNRGGNFIGIHSASDSLLNDTFFGHEIGAYFDYHPALQNATVNVLNRSHPSTSMLPARWQVQDEMYNFKSDPRAIGATVILSADESTYNDNGERKFDQGTPHPTAWYQERGAGVEEGGTAGRSFYTSLGHLNETWQDNLFIAHVLGGIQWALQSNTRNSSQEPTATSSLTPSQEPQKLPSDNAR
ncbi:class I glutamine amidotransferase-like protein [Marasmius fiardii PR-910]|nr:class I glutamine amidotransferase-like protein [Marasmius fiardii PR-910]